jgi:hypothetical protein
MLGQRHLRLVLAGYEARYNRHDDPSQPPAPPAPGPTTPVAGLSQKQIKRRPDFGALLNECEPAG